LQKKHCGNDEVKIIWTEHWRDFRISTLKSRFNDAVLVIYPLKNGMYRIRLHKPKVTRDPPVDCTG
jgi:hypothetical protein